MTTLILVRHGETEANLQQLWYGSMDAPLTARGEQQIVATARHFGMRAKEQQIDAFYVSPLGRTRKTARAIAQAIGMEPTVFDELREFDLGDWEGRSLFDLQETEDLWERWKADPAFAPPNGESPQSFGERSLRVARHLADTHPGQTILAVTHGGIVCNVMAAWVGNGLDEWAKWEPHYCAITILQWERERGRWRALAFSDIAHLPAELIVHQEPPYAESVGGRSREF